MDLEVVGRHALLFDDDSSAAFVNSADALVEWHSLNIDRYDVRHLLSAPPPSRRRNRSYEPRTPDDAAVEFLIDQERYIDLPLESDQPELEEEEEKENPSSSGGYRSVAFSYGNTDESTDQKNSDVGMEASGYLPPFSVPEDIVQKLPPTEKVHQIIARTATFVSKHGGQSEIILRVKQGDNPAFGFLMPDHHLHAYFRYLVEHPELLHAEIDEKSQDERKTDSYPGNVGGALSLLGSVYGSGEEEEESDDAVDASPSDDTKIVETAAKGESISRKPILSNKDKVSAVKKNSSIIGSKPKSVKGTKKEENSGLLSAAEENLKSHGIGATSKQILEPPPELKRLIDKLVEFVIRNGKQFEATLLEQDSKLERFFFLLPSNQYHPYYLNALQASQESKVNGKSIYSGQEDQSGRGISKKAFVLKEDNNSYSASEFRDVPFESDRKEKFKMVIGKSKKEAHETESGFTVDAAAVAAILQAATKGIKSSGLQIIRSTASSCHNGVRNEETIAGTASHGTAGGTDSSDANLTEEQKLKAERLKRAKMFVAMLKSGALPSRTGTSRGSSVEPIEQGVLKSAGEVSRASQEREGSLAPAVVEKPVAKVKSAGEVSRASQEREGSLAPAVVHKPAAKVKSGEVSRASQEREGSLAPAVVDKPTAKVNSDEELSERRSKRKYRSRSIGSEDDEEDSCREGNSSRKYRSKSKSRRHDDNENENEIAVEKEGRYCGEKRRHRRSHSSHHSQREDDMAEGIREEKSDEIENEHHLESSYRSRSRSHMEDEEVGNAVEKDRKHSRRRHKSHSSSEESDNVEESVEHDTERKHYKAKHRSRHSQGDDNEHRKSGSRRSYGSKSRRHYDNSETQNAVEKEDSYYRKKHSSHSSYEENVGESSGDDMNHQHSKLAHRSSHSKHKDDGHEDIYREEKDHKRSRKSRRSHHSSSESPVRRKKHRSSHASHHSRDKHRHKNVRSSRNRHKHDSSSYDEKQHRARSDQPGKELHDVRNELEEGEISSKVGITSGDGQRGTEMNPQQRAASQPPEITDVPDDLRAKIRAMLMATRS